MSTLARKALVIFLIWTISQPAYPQKDIVTRDSDGNIEYRDSDGNFMENEAYEVSDDGMTSKYAYESPETDNENKRESHSFEHSGEAGESRTSNGAGGNNGSKGFYEGVIQKSRTDRNYAIQSSQNIDSRLQKSQIAFSKIVSNASGESLASGEMNQTISHLIGSLVNSNQATLFSSFSGQYENNKFKNEIYQQEALKEELRRLFPDLYGQNIQQIKQAQDVLRNWTLVGQLMKNSGFDSSLVEAENAISNVQKSVDLTGLGPVDRKLMVTIDQFNQDAFSRFADYISNYLASIPTSQFDLGTNQKIEVERLIFEAFKSVSQNHDYLAAASSLLQAKEILKYSEPPHESEFGPDDLIGAGSVVAALGKGLSRFGSKELLIKIVNIEDRNAIRKVLTEFTDNGITVLGKTGKYEAFGKRIGANIFEIKPALWKMLTQEEWWIINKEFLDKAVLRGDRIVLSQKVTDINKVNGFLKRELDYLINEKNYRLSANGRELLK